MLALDSLAAYDDAMAGGGGGNDLFARCLNIALESQVRLQSLGFSLDLSLVLFLSLSLSRFSLTNFLIPGALLLVHL
jgi:hypothetical protein